MKLYHRTTSKAAEAILRGGFNDTTGSYLVPGHSVTGVWVSNIPVDVNEGAKGDVLLEINLDAEEGNIADYEWVEEGKFYREWLIPAEFLNRRGSIRIVEDE